MLDDFKAFLIKQNVVALAIAVVVGTALNELVKALVDDFIMPIAAAGMPDGEWQTATWDVGPVSFGTGHFMSVALNFLIVGLVVWRIARAFIRPPAEPAKATTKQCPYCKMTIDNAATKCPHCTSQL